MLRECNLLLILGLVFGQAGATNYYGTPDDYLPYLNQLEGGDTLFLAGGTYLNRMNLDDLVGSPGAPIVITGPVSGPPAVFPGNACCNTVSLERCGWLTIRYLTLDGQDIAYIDAVKAEGTPGNWAHDITIEHLTVINHAAGDLIVGINTKCPAWNWVIRFNTFLEPGLGMYLGAPDGTAPFVHGLIEYNLIVNPRRYGIQVKHQVNGVRDFDGMPDTATTIIRYNVISKAMGSDPGEPRPNLLVGAFPPEGPGSTDHYEIYGNLLWQNPAEGLFQGTGNYAFYNNLLVNHLNGWGIYAIPHNGFQPRDVMIFNNTIVSRTQGIRLSGVNEEYNQVIAGNAIFSDQPIYDSGIGSQYENAIGSFEQAEMFLQSPGSVLAEADFTPKEGLGQSVIDPGPFLPYMDADLDFDCLTRDWYFRGAYASIGDPSWHPALEIRPGKEDIVNSVLANFENTLQLFPNPIPIGKQFFLTSPEASTPDAGEVSIRDLYGREVAVFHMQGEKILTIPTRDWSPGIYIVTVFHGGRLFSSKVLAQ